MLLPDALSCIWVRLWVMRNGDGIRDKEGRAMQKGETTKQRIIEKAAELFNQRGFTGCSMQDIMQATGMEKGGLYRHFRSKEELAIASFRFAVASSIKLHTADSQSGLGAVQELHRMIERFVTTPSAVPGGCPLMNTAIDADDGNPTLRSLALREIQAWKRRIVAVVEEGKSTGEVRADVDSSWLANTVVSMLEGAVMVSRLERSRQPLLNAQASLHIVIASTLSSQRRASGNRPTKSLLYG